MDSYKYKIKIENTQIEAIEASVIPMIRHLIAEYHGIASSTKSYTLIKFKNKRKCMGFIETFNAQMHLYETPICINVK